MDLFPHVDDFDFYIVIRVKNNKTTEVVEFLKWIVPFKVFCKWDWYFRYRHALFQITYPRFEVQTFQGKYLKPVVDLENSLKNKITAAKRKVTELENKLEKARFKASETELFGIEDEPIVIEFKKRIDSKKEDLKQLQDMSIQDFYLKFKDRYPEVNFEDL